MQASNFDAQSIPCNAGSVSFSGGQGYYVAQAVVLGEGIGPVTCSFQSYSVPDRFRLYWSGSTVADSLVVGDQLKFISNYNSYTSSFSSVSNLTRYDYNYSTNEWSTGSAVSVSYTSASFPPYSGDNGPFTRNVAYTESAGSGLLSWITGSRVSGNPTRGNWGDQFGVVPDYPVLLGSNYSSSCVEGEVLLSFYKHTKFPTTFDIIIEGPDSGTGWDLESVSCPTDSTLNSSSIAGFGAGGNSIGTVYHTAPTFDLRPGMKIYYDSNLTQPFSSSRTFLTIYSGSIPTNPPSTTGSSGAGIGNTGWCFGFHTPDTGFDVFLKVTDGSDSNSAGMITNIACIYPV